MSRAAWVTAAALVAVVSVKQIPFDDYFPIERHTSSIPAGTPENIASACSASTGSSFGFLGLELYKSTHTRLDANCSAFAEIVSEVSRQQACAKAQGVEAPSSVLLAANRYCP